MASIALINSLSESFTHLRNSFLSSSNKDDTPSLENTVVTRPIGADVTDDVTLFSTPPPPSSPPPTTQPPLFSSTPTSSSQNITSTSLFTATQPSSLSSTELPPTQSLVVRLKRLRNVDASSSSTPHYRVIDDDEHLNDVGDERVDENILLRQQLEELKSELTALRLQYDIDREEKRTLVRENEELRRKLLSSPSSPSSSSPTSPPSAISNREHDDVTSIAAPNQGPVNSAVIETVPPLPLPPLPQPNLPTPQQPFQRALSRNQKRKQRQRAKAANSGTGNFAAAAAAAAAAAENPSSIANNNNQATITIHVFHDSNTKATSAELLTYHNNITKNNANNINNIQFQMHDTFTLEKTRDKIKKTTFTKNDHAIITTLTNNARYTNSGRHSTVQQTTKLQTEIISLLSKTIARNNIVFLEAPPLLPPSPDWLRRRNVNPRNIITPDIYPYNQATFDLARNHGVKFAPLLVGEEHMFDDGFHVLHRFRHFLHRSVAAAATSVDPYAHYKLRRPPYGPHGPWASPRGVGLLPRPLMPPNNLSHFPFLPRFRDVALSHPLKFRPKIPNIQSAN